jgi:hypothetical protein
VHGRQRCAWLPVCYSVALPLELCRAPRKGLAVIYVLDAPSGARRPTPPVTASVSRAKANVTWLQSVPNPLGLHAPPNSDLPILGPARRIWSRWRAHIDGHSFVSLLSNSGMPIEDLARNWRSCRLSCSPVECPRFISMLASPLSTRPRTTACTLPTSSTQRWTSSPSWRATESPLEFGIGTGRIAIPLRARGISVYGVDLSPDMVAALRDRPGGVDVPVTMVTWPPSVWNESSPSSMRCGTPSSTSCRRTSRCSAFEMPPPTSFPAGTSSSRPLVPRLQGLCLGETVRASAFGPNNADVDEYDMVAQRITSHHYWNDGGRWETWSSPCRYVWPSELDLMGRIAGVALVARWGGWLREPFTGESTSQVSVFGRPAADGLRSRAEAQR